MRLHVLVGAVRRAVSSPVFVCRFITSRLGRLLIYLSYFLTIDLLGFLALVLLNKPGDADHSGLIRYVDMLFMSTSAVTVTGLATVRMERLSGSQTVVLNVLMLLGSETFVTFLALALDESSARKRKQPRHGPDHHVHGGVRSVVVSVACDDDDEEANQPSSTDYSYVDDDDQKKSWGCLRGLLALLVLVYMIVILLLGSLAAFSYVANVPSARDVLTKKSINVALFSASATVSSFTNGGLLPTDESIAVFATNKGLLLLLTGQILAGGTLFPVFLRVTLRATARPSGHEDDELIIRFTSTEHATTAAGFTHLLLPGGGLQTAFVAATAVTVAAAAVTLFCCLSWDTAVFTGLTAGEKVTNALFMAVNARQAGENSVDCSLIAPAVLVLFVAMMCTPASASFFLVHYGGHDGGERSGGGGELERRGGHDGGAEKTRQSSLNSMFSSPLAFNAAVVMLVCVTERRSLSSDPLNFSTFNMMFEVISAYRNVGLSTGYSCSRLLLRPAEAASVCHDEPYSFTGWWSDQGKLVIVLVMLCGRLKGFYRQQRRS